MMDAFIQINSMMLVDAIHLVKYTVNPHLQHMPAADMKLSELRKSASTTSMFAELSINVQNDFHNVQWVV